MQAPRAAGRTITIVLSGAVTRGAFDAGVLSVLAERGVKVARVVAASSGALTGAVYAAGVRAREDRRAAAELVKVWRDEAGLRDILHFSALTIAGRRGLSDHKKLLALLRRHARPSSIVDPAPIELHMIVAPLRGVQGSVGTEASTTYTVPLSFQGESFDSEEGLEDVFRAALASSSFPLLLAPVFIPNLGYCVDGGLVSSTPVRFAWCDNDAPDVDAVLVTAPTPSHWVGRGPSLRGRRLMARVVDMLFSERVYHDLHDEAERDAALAKLEELAARSGWSPAELREARAALGLERQRPIPIVSIRPLAPLRGDLFTGFFSASERRRDIDVGMERASRVLDELGWR